MYMYVCRCLPLANHLPPEDPAWCHDKTPTSSTQCCQDDFCNTRENYNGVIPGESCLKTIKKAQNKNTSKFPHIHLFAIPRTTNTPASICYSQPFIHPSIHPSSNNFGGLEKRKCYYFVILTTRETPSCRLKPRPCHCTVTFAFSFRQTFL